MKKSILIGMILLESLVGWTQEAISAQGNHDVLGDVQVSWTLGELVSGEYTAGDILISQGLNQPVIKSLPLGIGDKLIEVEIYPNPTTEIVTIRSDQSGLKYSLISTAGKYVESGSFQNKELTVDFSSQPAGTYILQLNQKNKISSFKIIKSE